MKSVTVSRTTLTVLLLSLFVVPAFALSLHHAEEIDARVSNTLARFESRVRGASELMHRARAVLVFPGVTKAAFVFGGEHGNGELRINGRTAGYYSLTAGSWGIQVGVEQKDIIIAFMTDEALRRFRQTDGFTIGGDAAVTLIKVGADGSIDTNTLTQPVVAMVRNQKGLMLDLSLNGTKISRLHVK